MRKLTAATLLILLSSTVAKADNDAFDFVVALTTNPTVFYDQLNSYSHKGGAPGLTFTFDVYLRDTFINDSMFSNVDTWLEPANYTMSRLSVPGPYAALTGSSNRDGGYSGGGVVYTPNVSYAVTGNAAGLSVISDSSTVERIHLGQLQVILTGGTDDAVFRVHADDFQFSDIGGPSGDLLSIPNLDLVFIVPEPAGLCALARCGHDDSPPPDVMALD